MELPFPTLIVWEVITDYRLAASEIPGSLAEILTFRMTDFRLPLPTFIFLELNTMSITDTDLNYFELDWSSLRCEQYFQNPSSQACF